jgi:hypothetical protein
MVIRRSAAKGPAFNISSEFFRTRVIIIALVSGKSF